MGFEKSSQVRIVWDLNDALLERVSEGKPPLVTFPFSEKNLDAALRIIEDSSHFDVTAKLRQYHDYLDPNFFRRLNRAILPEFSKWRFLEGTPKQSVLERTVCLLENALDLGESYRKYIKPYSLSINGLLGIENSFEKGYENSTVSGMPWTVRNSLKRELSLVLPYLSKECGILLNPDLKRVSGAHIKPFTWLSFNRGVVNGLKEKVVVVDDDHYIIKLAEHLGMMAFCTVSEREAIKQEHKLGVFEFPGKRNGNGQIIYGCSMDEIPERVANAKLVL